MTREELEKLDSAQLITLLLELIAENARLKEQLGQNSRNSSKPPSSDGYSKPSPKSLRKKSSKKVGGQKGHTGHGMKLRREADITIDLTQDTCAYCGGALQETEAKVVGTRYKYDLPVQRCVLTKYRQTKRHCPHCGKDNTAPFPADLTSTQQYGANIRTLAVLLVEYGMVSVERTQTLMRTMLGISISCGSIQQMVNQCAKLLRAPVLEIGKAVQKASVVHFDETGVRTKGKLNWLHSASTKSLTHLHIEAKRGVDGMNLGEILPGFTGVAVHDCFASYFRYDGCTHALCNVHLLRELAGVYETSKQPWAEKMALLLIAMKNVVTEYSQQGKTALSPYYRRKFNNAYAEIVSEGLSLNPSPMRNTGKRGRIKLGKPGSLLARFVKYKTEILRFSSDFNVAFDNNQAERDIRISKVKMKVSGGFRARQGANDFATIQSFVQTMKKQGSCIWDAIARAFAQPQSLATE